MEGEDANGEEPKGLYMSLDDLITENKDKSYGPQRGARGRGRGPVQQNRFDGGAGRRQQVFNRGRGQGQMSERSGVTCFNCGQPGHISRECPNQDRGAGGGGGAGPMVGGQMGGGQLGPCFACGQMGHIQRDCPLAAGAGGGGGGGMAVPRMGAVAGGGMGFAAAVGPAMGMGLSGGPMGMMGGGMGLLNPDEIMLRKMQLMQQQEQLAMMEQQVLQMQQQRQRMVASGGPGAGPMQRPQQQAQLGVGEVPVLKHDAYRKDQRCFLEEASGDVVVTFKATQIVRVTPGGDISLNTGGWYTPTTLASMNDALNVLGIRVTAPSGEIHGGEWSITDGRALTRYFDGVVLPSKGGAHTTRGRQLLQAFQNPNRGAAAAATAASNAAAAQAGIVPNMGYGGGGGGGGYGGRSGGGGGGGRGGSGGRGGVFTRLGGRVGDKNGQELGSRRMQMDEDEDAARARRLRAQGRYNPY